MTEQEYVRKYMLKDIVRRNLKFIWLIVLCAVLFAAGLGYKKYDEYQKRFYKIALKGTPRAPRAHGPYRRGTHHGSFPAFGPRTPP